ncbi:MAG: hypothetical protein HY275_04480 [Gemmatimonadetes bacterium]|nr:hypothetical protein [Gemmatimonadota bacterium]
MSRHPERFTLLGALLGASAVLLSSAVIAGGHAPAWGQTRYARLMAERSTAASLAVFDAELAILAGRADSLRAETARRPWPSDSLLVLADPRLPAWRRDGDEAILRREFAHLRGSPAGARVAVALIADSVHLPGVGRAMPWASVMGQVLPTWFDGQTCLVVLQRPRLLLLGDARAALRDLQGGVDTSLSIFWLGAYRPSLGACGFVHAYGMPGRGMRAWLDSTGWRGAASATFDTGAAGREPWLRTSGPVLLNSVIASVGVAADSVTLGAQGCARGRPGACRRFVHEAAHQGHANGRDIMVPEQFVSHVGVGNVEAGDPRVRMLDDLRREKGAEKFGALWHDDRPFEEAFAAVMGEPLDAWAQRWMHRSIVPPGATYGPMPSAPSLLVAGVPVVLLLVAGLLLAHRRQMGIVR